MGASSGGIGALVHLDNRDDRREVFYLLSQLTLTERTHFLNFCIRIINDGIRLSHDPPWVLVRAWSDTGTLNESYFDLMAAIAKYHLKIEAVVEMLELYVTSIQKIPTQAQRQALSIEYEKLPNPELGVQRILER